MSYYFHENVSYIERKENNLKLCSNQDLFIAFAVGKNRNNSNNKKLSNLKETEWKLKKTYYIVGSNNNKNKPNSAYWVCVIVIVINYSIY